MLIKAIDKKTKCLDKLQIKNRQKSNKTAVQILILRNQEEKIICTQLVNINNEPDKTLSTTAETSNQNLSFQHDAHKGNFRLCLVYDSSNIRF